MKYKVFSRNLNDYISDSLTEHDAVNLLKLLGYVESAHKIYIDPFTGNECLLYLSSF